MKRARNRTRRQTMFLLPVFPIFHHLYEQNIAFRAVMVHLMQKLTTYLDSAANLRPRTVTNIKIGDITVFLGYFQNRDCLLFLGIC